MIIDNKNWLDDLYCCLSNAYNDKKIFKEFCGFIADYKKCGFSYEELDYAIRTSKKISEDMVELSIYQKEKNVCYKYRISEKMDKYIYYYYITYTFHTNKSLLKDFLDRKDCAEHKEFDVFVSEQYKTISCRTMDYEPEYTGDNILFLGEYQKE